MNLYEMLKHSADKNPQKIALICKNESISYRELFNFVRNTRNNLKQLDVKPGERVGLVLHNSIEYVICLYALSDNQNITCLLNPQWTILELERKFIDGALDTIIVESYVFKHIEKECPRLSDKYRILLKTDCVVKEKNTALISDGEEKFCSDESLPALMQSSSGTTNLSKMAYRTHRNLDRDSVNIIETMNYESSDVIFAPIPLCHGYGLTMGVIAPIRCGATIYIQRWFEFSEFIKNYHDLKPNVFLGVPEIYDCMYSELKGKKFSFIYNKYFLCSGSPLSRETGENFYAVSDIFPCQLYGMMEVSTICVNKKPDQETLTSVGKQISDIEIKYKPTERSGYYEILIRGETVSQYYVINGEKVPAVDNEGWYYTKDIGFIKDENLYLVGRKEK